MSTARYLVGDVFDVLRSLPDASVDIVLSSPPFLALRSYLPADHPDKAKEIGGEPTPGEFIDTLLDVVEECRRVLAPHGSLCFELGDTYAGSGGAGGDYNAGGLREGQERFDGSASKARRMETDPRYPEGRFRKVRRRTRAVVPGWPLDKSLTLVPELFRLSLAYGFNPLTGRETERWRVRNVVRWCRPNPPVGALSDKFRPATSEMVVACASRTRYFDLDAVRTPPSGYNRAPAARATPPGQKARSCLDTTNHAGRPPYDWWEIPTEPYKGSHYATWPTALLHRPILAMCPQRVCTVCGEPSSRIVSVEHVPNRTTNGPQSMERRSESPGYSARADRSAETLGWTDCGHDSWRNGVVLDPFAGSGTTLEVATGHGRDALGIDLDDRNADLARQRVGMFLTVEHFAGAVA